MSAVAHIEPHDPFAYPEFTATFRFADLAPTPKPRPAVVLPAGTQTFPIARCEEISCRRPMQLTTDTKSFCCPSCRRKHHTRREQRARVAYDALMAFTDRKRRGKGMTELSRLALDWKAEDAAMQAAAEAQFPLATASSPKAANQPRAK